MRSNRRKSNNPTPIHLTNNENKGERIALTADKDAINTDLYGGAIITIQGQGAQNYKTREVAHALAGLYHNKCAYCESMEYSPDIEHYRPKKRVSGERHHPGYYWLCIEWSNLLPSCGPCNSINGGKGTKFPLMSAGTRQTAPPLTPAGRLNKARCQAAVPPLSLEMPYLLHPEVDTPENYFRFLKTGVMKGSDMAGRGKKTISICNLNRQNLIAERAKLMNDIVARINGIFLLVLNNEITVHALSSLLKEIFIELKQRTETNKPFSLCSLYIYKHFDELIVSRLAISSLKKITRNAYRKYKNGEL